MDGIVDYIGWMGRFSFAELPMNELDAFVLCVISYFDLSPVVGAGGTVRVRDCAEALDDGRIRIQITGGDMGNGAIFRMAARSRRFGELAITDHEDILRPEVPLQFSAVTFRDETGLAFIAYRGTDETIAGWRENFMISFTRTEAQQLAADYAGRVVTGSEGRYYMGGHSKGGNLVLYAACGLSDAAWRRVEHVYILDGPGLCPEVLDTSGLARVDVRATRVLPEFSVVGKLFEPKLTNTHIVRSSAKGILQHSLATWGVDHGAPALAPEHDRSSVALMQVLNGWIGGMDAAGRQTLTDDLFGALAAGGAVTLSDIAGGGPEGFETVLVRLFHASPVTRRIMKALPQQAAHVLRQKLLGHGRPAEPGQADAPEET